MMQPVDRFVSFMTGKPVDRPPLFEDGPWAVTLDIWKNQGMGDLDRAPYLDECDPLERTMTDLWMLPRYEEKILEEDEHSVIKITDRGILEELLKPIGQGMPLHIRYPVETRADWDALKPSFAPDSGDRLGADWASRCGAWRTQGTTVIFQGPRSPSLFGFVRELMGPEKVLLAFYDDPLLVHDMMETSAELALTMLARVLDSYPLKVLWFWEDMAYKAGPLISPKTFREFMSPRYRRICDYALSRGVEIIMVDSDGDISQLIPLWLEAGLTGVYPLEVQAGMDVARVLNQYPGIMVRGGCDKRALAQGPAAIDAELRRTIPLVEKHRYLHALDHAVPPDVPWANMMYYWQQKKRMLGITGS
jgi:uroporphyrinogen decarboxylase